MSPSRSPNKRLWRFVRRVPNDGTLDAVAGAHRNIEDLTRTEHTLRHSQADLAGARRAEAQRLSHTGSFGWNVSSGEIIWSEEAFRIFGYEPPTDVTLEMVLARVHPDDLAAVQRAIDRAATHKEAFDLEHRLRMPDGSVKHLHVVAHAFVDEPQNLQFAGATWTSPRARRPNRRCVAARRVSLKPNANCA
jgi:PAS domain-containing protein